MDDYRNSPTIKFCDELNVKSEREIAKNSTSNSFFSYGLETENVLIKAV